MGDYSDPFDQKPIEKVKNEIRMINKDINKIKVDLITMRSDISLIKNYILHNDPLQALDKQKKEEISKGWISKGWIWS
jgi:hypothetical protein